MKMSADIYVETGINPVSFNLWGLMNKLLFSILDRQTLKLWQKEKCSLNTCKRKCIIFNPICRSLLIGLGMGGPTYRQGFYSWTSTRNVTVTEFSQFPDRLANVGWFMMIGIRW